MLVIPQVLVTFPVSKHTQLSQGSAHCSLAAVCTLGNVKHPWKLSNDSPSAMQPDFFYQKKKKKGKVGGFGSPGFHLNFCKAALAYTNAEEGGQCRDQADLGWRPLGHHLCPAWCCPTEPVLCSHPLVKNLFLTLTRPSLIAAPCCSLGSWSLIMSP